MVIKVQRKEWRIIMDKIDKKLITLLQNNARMPLKALAEKCIFIISSGIGKNRKA